MTFLGFTADEWHIAFVALLWLGLIPTIIYSFKKISKFRRGLYLLAIPIVVGLGLLYIDAFLHHYDIHWHLMEAGLVLRVAIFLVALEFYLVSYVDRIEYRLAGNLAQIVAATEIVKEQLLVDQQLTMDEQHHVMDDQRQVMKDQREGLGNDPE